MNNLRSNRAALWCCASLLAYGFFSVLFSAAMGGITYDEGIYLSVGMGYLKVNPFQIFVDHPPFSYWFGCLLPYWAGKEDLVLARIPHAFLYLFAGVFITSALGKMRGSIAALAFCALYSLCPETKAMAALHINDFDVAAFTVLAVTAAYLSQSTRLGLVLLSGVFTGLAAGSKITGLIAFAASGLSIASFMNMKLDKKKIRLFFFACILLLVGFFIGLWAAYLFHWREMPRFIESYRYQRHTHNQMGHNTSILGELSHNGFWYFYALSFFFSLPLLHLGFLALSSKFQLKIKNIRYLAPALASAAMFLVLSKANIQLGLRYFLPGVLLLYFWGALAAPEVWTWIQNWKTARYALVAALALTIMADAQTLFYGSYISAFNILTPSPTRNFAESNIDWGQGLPKHLKRNTFHSPLAAFVDTAAEFEEAPVETYIGPNIINGVFQRELRGFRGLPVGKVVAGYERHVFSAEDLFSVIFLVDNYRDDPPMKPLQIQTLETGWKKEISCTALNEKNKALVYVPPESASVVDSTPELLWRFATQPWVRTDLAANSGSGFRVWLSRSNCEPLLKQLRKSQKRYYLALATER